MSLTEETTIAIIEVDTINKIICVVNKNVIKKDDVMIGSEFTKSFINEGDDYSGQPAQVRAVCDSIFS